MTSPRQKTQIIKDTIRRFNHLPTRTLSRYVLNTHGPDFENDLEKIRATVRYHRGQMGDLLRKKSISKDLHKTNVKMPKTWAKQRQDYRLSPGAWLVLSDIHVPFHEIKPLEVAIQAGQAEKVDGIFLNGDVQDCASMSFWQQAHRDFNGEVEAVVDFLDLLRQEFPKKPIIYKPGNHEGRLPSYYISHAPELAETPLACMETLLGFEERGIEFLDYYQKVKAGKLPIIHGHEVRAISRAVNPARGLFLKAKTFCACSHCHSTSEHTPKNIEGEILTTWSFGCLCHLEPDWNPYGNDWNWGFAILNVEKNGDFEVINRRILPNGMVA